MSRAMLYLGDALAFLQTLPVESVQCCVSSPPYWGLRDYGMPGQLGLERTPEEYVEKMTAVFREVRRVLRKDGTLWLNVGDSYAAGGKGGGGSFMDERRDAAWQKQSTLNGWRAAPPGLKTKDLVGIPWRLAFALQADGWWLRSDIIWAKPNPMPESVTDRPTKAHEYIFLLSKSERYYYDAAAIAEKSSRAGDVGFIGGAKGRSWEISPTDPNYRGENGSQWGRRIVSPVTRNARTVWEIATQPYAEAHFATFPEELARRCILAGSCPGDMVLDPFGGTGTVAKVATGNGRSSTYIDLNPKYRELALRRIGPLLCEVA